MSGLFINLARLLEFASTLLGNQEKHIEELNKKEQESKTYFVPSITGRDAEHIYLKPWRMVQRCLLLAL